jgi:tetratricopeptide (TPR) repeat protein
MSEDFKVIHHSEGERRVHSLTRNIELLGGMYQRQQKNGNLDPRTLFYLATHYFDARRLNEAKQLFQDYLQLAGWAEERCEALVYLGKIHEAEGKDGQAKHAYLLAIGEYQNNIRPYIELSEIEYRAKRYENSADWIDKALQLPKPTTTMVQRPMESTYRAYMLAAQAYVNLGGKKLDDDLKYVH